MAQGCQHIVVVASSKRKKESRNNQAAAGLLTNMTEVPALDQP